MDIQGGSREETDDVGLEVIPNPLPLRYVVVRRPLLGELTRLGLWNAQDKFVGVNDLRSDGCSSPLWPADVNYRPNELSAGSIDCTHAIAGGRDFALGVGAVGAHSPYQFTANLVDDIANIL